MSHLHSPDWYRALVTLRQSIGKADFYDRLLQTLKQLVDCQYSGVFIYSDDHVDCVLLQQDAESPEAGEQFRKYIDLYLEGLYLLDPHYSMLARGAETGLYRFRDIAPDCYHKTEYYQRFVKPAGITDEYDFIVKIDDRYLDFFIDRLDGDFSEDESRRLQAVAPLLLDFLQQHGRLQQSASSSRPGKSYNSIFDSLGTSLLTQRERDVFQCILHGHSSKSIAHKLDIALGTVKIHRRNIYHKLDISSQSELFSLCVQSLSIPEVSGSSDPLAALRQRVTRPQVASVDQG